MSQQPSVASFYGKRKRITDDVFRLKILKTGEEILSTKVVVSEKSPAEVSSDKTTSKKITSEIVKTFRAAETKSTPCLDFKGKPKVQTDIRNSFNKCNEGQIPLPSLPGSISPVKFQLMGSLSPAKKNNQAVNVPKNEFSNSLQNMKELKKKAAKNLDFSNKNEECPTEEIIKSARQLVCKIKDTQRKLNGEKNQRKELSLKEIKDKIKRSSKLRELKKSISKINEHAEELIELEKKKLTGTQPRLSKFRSIKVEVPLSPKKNGYCSTSGIKLESKSPIKPAYEKFAALVDATSSLPLPFGFRKLFELFKAVDTVCSMMINRGEVITFSKLKPAVEEMTRRNFTHRHLGQMATVSPSAYSFHQEKLKNFGSTSKVDKYELVVAPILPRTNRSDLSPPRTPAKEDDVFQSADHSAMTPKVIKARRETFYEALLERTKDFHEEFLKTLDPPITINRKDLKRWHPNFLVDLVPDVIPQELPQPPTNERPSTAKEILERAKDFLGSNARLHKALEAAAHSGNDNASADTPPKVSLEVREKVDARLNNPLKGISKSLLEKVRARQAAKALDAMRMTPEQEKEILAYARLPDIARIVRTVFINEQKGVLLLEIVLEKVQFSYNRNLTLSEIDSHIRLLTEKLPEWLSIVHIRNTDYLKISRSVDVTPVMAKLTKIVEQKKQETKTI